MTPKEKAIELRDEFKDDNYNFETEILEAAKLTALQVVDVVTKALIEYGQDSGELQNMDAEMRFWGQVKTELENL